MMFPPPKKKPARSPIRPVTIVEVLEAGYRYKVFYGGGYVELLTQPALNVSSNPQVGDLVMARNVHGAAELFLPAARQEQACIVVIPGHSGEVPTLNDIDIYIIRSGVCSHFVKFWDYSADPVTTEYYISHAFWWPAKKKFYVWTADYNGVKDIDGYELNLSTGATTALGLSSVLQPSGAGWANDQIWDSCEFKGDMYLAGWQEDPGVGADLNVLYKFDGTTLTEVDSSTNIYGDLNGLWVVTDGTTLYWHVGDGEIRKSTDGSTFSLHQTVNIALHWIHGPCHWNNVTNKMTTIAETRDESPRQPWSFEDIAGNWAEDNQVATNPSGNTQRGFKLGFRYPDNAADSDPVREYVWTRKIDDDPDWKLYTRPASGGAWTYDNSLSGGSEVVAFMQDLVSIDGQIYTLIANPYYQIYTRDSDSGAWRLVKNFGYSYNDAVFRGSGMYLATVSRTPQLV